MKRTFYIVFILFSHIGLAQNNAFFEQVASMVKDKKLILKPISIVMISDGQPDVPGSRGEKQFRNIKVKPLETLSRNVTLRVLYTNAVVGMGWRSKVPRRRVKIWTQDAQVMTSWKDKKILQPNRSFAKPTSSSPSGSPWAEAVPALLGLP